MGEYLEIIGQIKPKNNNSFPIADVNDLKGGYIQVDTVSEMNAFLYTNKVKEGMLCYVKTVSDGMHMYQCRGNSWVVWTVEGTSSGGGIVIVDLLTDLDNTDLQIKGKLVFVNEISDLRFYNGSYWESFSRIYIQSTEPQDKGGIWIDTSDNNIFTDSNAIVQNLLAAINVLQEKVRQMEYAFKNQIDSGDFTNNEFTEYNDWEQEEPSFGTDIEEDQQLQQEYLESEVTADHEPTDLGSIIPNAKHICIKAGTYAQMVANKNDFLVKELLWCTDTKSLYIKDPITFNLIKIGSSSIDPEEPTDTMDGILTEIINSKTKITGIEFVDINNKNNAYLLQVKDGTIDLHDYNLDKNTLAGNAQIVSTGSYYTNAYFPITSENVGSTTSPKIYVNMVYCGDESNSKSYNYCSHNFIELCNLGNTDLNLKGLYLHYTERGSNNWVTLPLKGVLKSQGTFVIRGAQCSVENINTTVIKVNDYDLLWDKLSTYNSNILEVVEDVEAGVSAHTIWGENNAIKLSYNCALFISAEESTDYFKTNVLSSAAPWTSNGVVKWYVDLVGIGSYNSITMPCEATAISKNNTTTLLMRYYNMDPVSQATKAISARSNSKDWTYINLANINSKLTISNYTPKASYQNKTIFFDKHLLIDGAPNIITCSFGANAHTTRCFNWLSVGYYDEYIWFREEGLEYDELNKFQSFKAGDSRTSSRNWNHSIYDRIRSITTDGTPFTVHKFIKDFPEPIETKKYYYKVGKDGSWSEERSFVMRGRNYVIANGYNFLHVTDQQGFTGEEYETWRVSAEFIKNNETYHWCLNTGDATQNGNRINEWIDYFNSGNDIFKEVEQMYTVGNNDLCPLDVYTLGDGSEVSKTNPINVQYFFTFEHPYTVPISDAGVYIPCVYSFVYGDTYYLAMNSEITELARTDIFKDIVGTNVYTSLQTWATNDLINYSADSSIKWRVAYCHESPFTIMTADLIMSYLPNISGTYTPDTTISRGGSHLNTVGSYWFSQFLQNNNFKLCLCGHKHTYSNSRYVRDNTSSTMTPTIYEPELTLAGWYTALPEREKMLCQLSSDNSVNYVRYVMSQATGYKLASNKELPAKNIPWLMEYYPVSMQVENNTTNTATVKVNSQQSFPHYMIWDFRSGVETETGTTVARNRIKGNSYKIKRKNSTATWNYKYNTPIVYTDLERAGGNGSLNPNNNIIIENL